MPFPFLDKVAEMLRLALADRVSPSGDDFLDLFAEEAVFEFPFSPGGAVHVEGKAKMADYLATIQGVALDEITLKASYPVTDNKTVVLEYDGKGRNLQSQKPYEQSYVTVLSTAGGRITHFREYINPLAVLKAADASERERLAAEA